MAQGRVLLRSRDAGGQGRAAARGDVRVAEHRAVPDRTPLQKAQDKLEAQRKACAESYAFWVGQRKGLGPSGRRYLLAATMDQHAKPPKRFA